MKITMECKRPALSARCFTSPAVEDLIKEIDSGIADRELAWLFTNCFPNTLDTTVFFRRDEEENPDTYVITGDIEAMWLRDSAAQVWPYLPLAGKDEILRAMIAGVVRRQARSVLLDPYANAFYRDPVFGYWKEDQTEMKPGVHERKWELDSLAYFFRISCGYWSSTGDLSPFDESWGEAVQKVLIVMRVEQSGEEDSPGSPYTFRRGEGKRPNARRKRCGLVRCGFRPSDDAIELPFLVPANAMMAAALQTLGELLKTLKLEALAIEAAGIKKEIRAALEKEAVLDHGKYGEIWAYETDGWQKHHLMDDANAPSLLSLPYLGFCTKEDPRYLRTRAFCLGPDNPYYVRGKAGSGVGSPHTGPGTIWPMSLIMQALTCTDDEEIMGCLRVLKKTHAGTGFMHESFDADNPLRFTRPWFAWANTLFGELVVELYRQRPYLLKSRFD
jgi:meiotically up-regulated gene 157 (Mug157) protein